MDVHASLDAPCRAGELFVFVDDLAKYPAWIDLVHRAEPEPVAESLAGDVEPVWQVELRARLGPLARSKRLRMQRTRLDPAAGVVRFERSEVDGRRHSPWVLDVRIDERAGTSTLHMHLHYGGGLWTGGVLERALADQITNGRERLLELVRSTR
jgi:hypothetical protein